MNYLKLLLRILLVNWWLTPILGAIAFMGWMLQIEALESLMDLIKEAWTL